ncbi:MAG: nicotinate-nucleotide adenylyltransferase [Microthrixaceae bacterium]
MARERLGIFGGTFDPPHIGHLVTALDVRHHLSLDRVLLVVNNVPWQKVGSRAISPVQDRWAMVDAAARDAPGLEASRIEIDAGGMSYTADTLAALLLERPDRDLFVILGADAAAGLLTWERAEEVRDLATIVVVDRPGMPTVTPLPGWRWEQVRVPGLEVSSTELRHRVRDGRPLDYLVPRAVIECIAASGLYRGGDQ